MYEREGSEWCPGLIKTWDMHLRVNQTTSGISAKTHSVQLFQAHSFVSGFWPTKRCHPCSIKCRDYMYRFWVLTTKFWDDIAKKKKSMRFSTPWHVRRKSIAHAVLRTEASHVITAGKAKAQFTIDYWYVTYDCPRKVKESNRSQHGYKHCEFITELVHSLELVHGRLWAVNTMHGLPAFRHKQELGEVYFRFVAINILSVTWIYIF